MNRAELRRFIVVALPFSLLLALGASIAVTAMQSDTAVAPGSIGDHWHASYQVYICGERQPDFPPWESGVHTHGDGIIHIHPFEAFEEGRGSRLVKFFEYGGGLLTQSAMRAGIDADGPERQHLPGRHSRRPPGLRQRRTAGRLDGVHSGGRRPHRDHVRAGAGFVGPASQS